MDGGTLTLRDSSALADGSSLTVGTDPNWYFAVAVASREATSVAVVPEPGTFWLVLAAALGRGCLLLLP